MFRVTDQEVERLIPLRVVTAITQLKKKVLEVIKMIFYSSHWTESPVCESYFGSVCCFSQNKLGSCFGFLSTFLQLTEKRERGIWVLLYDKSFLWTSAQYVNKMQEAYR